MQTVISAKRWGHIIPLAMVMYILAYVDRINVAMILPYIDPEFGLTKTDTGFAAGIFFVGYMLLQIPGGYLAGRWSAKKVVALLMLAWGIAAVATGFVENKTQLYVARFVLGIFEGGVWPAVLVLLATWFPQKERARANALWMTCLPLSAVLMAPFTGWLLTFLSWRTVFIVEGLPPLVWVFVWWFLIADRPSEARWVSPEERRYLEETAAAENAAKPESAGYWAAFTNPTVLWLIVAYFFWMSGFYGYTMWVPAVVKAFAGSGNSGLVGWISAVPFVFALIFMVVNSSWSDRRMKRQVHVAVPLMIGAVGLIAGQFVESPMLQLMFLCVAGIGVYGPYGPFWAVPSTLLRVEVAGAAMGLINAIGNLGGFAGPYIVGWVRDRSGSGFAGFFVLSVFLTITAVIFLMLGSDRRADAVPTATTASPRGRSGLMPPALPAE
jgi:sugar phosphate permease